MERQGPGSKTQLKKDRQPSLRKTSPEVAREMLDAWFAEAVRPEEQVYVDQLREIEREVGRRAVFDGQRLELQRLRATAEDLDVDRRRPLAGRETLCEELFEGGFEAPGQSRRLLLIGALAGEDEHEHEARGGGRPRLRLVREP